MFELGCRVCWPPFGQKIIIVSKALLNSLGSQMLEYIPLIGSRARLNWSTISKTYLQKFKFFNHPEALNSRPQIAIIIL